MHNLIRFLVSEACGQRRHQTDATEDPIPQVSLARGQAICRTPCGDLAMSGV